MATIDGANLGAEQDGGIPDSDDSGASGDAGTNEGTASGPLNPDAEPKRKRGRPRKDAGTVGSASGGTPASNAGKADRNESAQSQTPRRATQKALDLSGYGLQIQGFHAMAAVALKNPLIEISRGEADSLAMALSDVMKQYTINVSPTAMAWAKLIGVSAAVYGPKLMLTAAAKAATKKAQQSSAPQHPAQSSNAPGASPIVVGVPPVGAQPGKMVFG